jgi:hypothetical protein
MAGQMAAPSLLLPLLSFAGGLAGGVFGGYISKRGEIRAVHAELTTVVAQNVAITTATEQIKSQTSTAAVFKQQKWSAKKDAIIEAVKELGTFQHAARTHFLSMSSVREATSKGSLSGPVIDAHTAQVKRAGDILHDSLTSLERAKFLLYVFCDEAVKRQFDTVQVLIVESSKGDDLAKSGRAVMGALNELSILIGEDLDA